MRILLKTVTVIAALSLSLTSQINAYCSKCVKIEEERAKQQAKNPQPWCYYDDFINLHKKEQQDNQQELPTAEHPSKDKKSLNEPRDSSTSNNLKPSLYSSNFYINSNNNSLLAVNSKEPISNQDFFEEETAPPIPKLSSSPSPELYSTIYTILKTKDFLETLSSSFTLFIPTDEGFKRSSIRRLIDLTKPENREKLAALVSNHLIAKKILPTNFNEYHNLEIKALSGKNLTLSSKNGKLFIENVQILSTQYIGQDGVVYLIDQILE